MIIAGVYSFNGGQEAIEVRFPGELEEIKHIIRSVDSAEHKSKISREKTMMGKTLYKPSSLNKAFRSEFEKRDWQKHKVYCEYPTEFYLPEFTDRTPTKGAFREIDFVKSKFGVEVQFGKYAFMVYNVCAKMTIFHNMGLIDVGVEIVPIKSFANAMSTGVSYFEQFVWDLQHRGVSDIDIPVLILGVAA